MLGDNHLPENLTERGLEWTSDVSTLGQLTIPLGNFSSAIDKIELFIIKDSSQEVFCADLFLRVRNLDTQETKLSFILCEKQKAPMTAMSTTKWDFSAALLVLTLQSFFLKQVQSACSGSL